MVNLADGLFGIVLSLCLLGLIIWFWVLVFMVLVRANKALKLYIEKNK